MAKRLEYLDLTTEEFWRLPRYDSSLPDEPKRKTKKKKRWRKRIQKGWLVGEYTKTEGVWIIDWYMADTSGQFQKIMNKAW